MDRFSIKEVSINEIEKELRKLNSNKATTFGNIPTKILKQSSKSCWMYYKNSLRDGNFPSKLKCADVTPIFFKKNDPTKAKNYRLVSALPGVSKLFERLREKFENIDQFLSPYMHDYRKGFSTQRAILSPIEKRKKVLDNV